MELFVNTPIPPKSTANFLERGGDGCELRVKNALVSIFNRNSLRFYPVNPQPVTRNRFSLFFDGGFWLSEVSKVSEVSGEISVSYDLSAVMKIFYQKMSKFHGLITMSLPGNRQGGKPPRSLQ